MAACRTIISFGQHPAKIRVALTAATPSKLAPSRQQLPDRIPLKLRFDRRRDPLSIEVIVRGDAHSYGFKRRNAR